MRVKDSMPRRFTLTLHFHFLLLTFDLIFQAIWTGVRVAEGAGLENRYTLTGIVGSNPTLSVLLQELIIY